MGARRTKFGAKNSLRLEIASVSGLVTCPTTLSFGTSKPYRISQVTLLPMVSLENRTRKSGESLGNKFPKHIYHSIVCIGALVAHKEPDHWAVDAIGAPHVGERTEKQLISTFVDKIAELTPQLVTFNGNTFDLPVLRYRAMIHAVSASGLTTRLISTVTPRMHLTCATCFRLSLRTRKPR